MRPKTWTGAIPGLLRCAAGLRWPKEILDPRLVVPADADVQGRDERLDGRGQPVTREEHLGLQPTEEALAHGVVWQADHEHPTHAASSIVSPGLVGLELSAQPGKQHTESVD